MKKEIFDEFFKPYAQNVDQVDANSSFWKLSDKIILEIIKREILFNTNKDSVVMDAGGGSGRWVVKMSKETNSNFIIYDRSEDMLQKANENVKNAYIEDRVKIIAGDLTDIKEFDDNSIDFITSIYSPISFIYELETAFKELNRILKPGGKIIMMGHSLYNAIYSKINNYNSPAEEIKRLYKEHIIKWAPHVPELIAYSKESMEQELVKAGFEIEKTFGIPVFVQPGPEDFSPDNEGVSRISKYLEDVDNFNEVFKLEMASNSLPTVANRGMNIFTLATKPYGK
jgi:ubiquinone/menaquinone biosynthesis C-methylase UbiE